MYTHVHDRVFTDVHSCSLMFTHTLVSLPLCILYAIIAMHSLCTLRTYTSVATPKAPRNFGHKSCLILKSLEAI